MQKYSGLHNYFKRPLLSAVKILLINLQMPRAEFKVLPIKGSSEQKLVSTREH